MKRSNYRKNLQTKRYVVYGTTQTRRNVENLHTGGNHHTWGSPGLVADAGLVVDAKLVVDARLVEDDWRFAPILF